jgi:uncharacterized membrane protein YdbT with pleckstrin-like domain
VVRIFNASPRYLRYRLLGVFIGAVAAAVVAVFLLLAAIAQGGVLWFAFAAETLLAAVALFSGYFTARLDYEMRYYILTDRSVRIREGVLVLRESTLTFANVQNLRIRRGPLQQLFGIADVLVDTAGGGSGKPDSETHQGAGAHRGAIQGIENPAEIRDLVLGLLRKFRDAGLGDPEDAARHLAASGDEAQERWREILAEVKILRTVLAR